MTFIKLRLTFIKTKQKIKNYSNKNVDKDFTRKFIG